jgi:4-hydroxy-tetrahydrodipicolinate reductase
MRGGDIVGEHRLVFAGPGEQFEITHRAQDRSGFARGAVAAAGWVAGRRPSLYSMSDVLGL